MDSMPRRCMACTGPASHLAVPTLLQFELAAQHVTVLNPVTARLPFLPSDDNAQLSEEVRLRHRVLDLR